MQMRARYITPGMGASAKASEIFIVDNSDSDWKVGSYLGEWCDFARAIDIATA
jgi:hypothetical protein